MSKSSMNNAPSQKTLPASQESPRADPGFSSI